MVDGVAVDPPKGTNKRDLDPARRVDPKAQKEYMTELESPNKIKVG